MKLNIQLFASTNKTSHYNLSQYVANDKPTYLVDYNDDMSAIDTAIYNAKTQADLGVNNASVAQTTAESAQTTANTAVANAGTAQTTADSNSTNIGTLANLTTANKSNLVSAISEVKNEEVAGFNKFNLSTLDVYLGTEMTLSGCTYTSGGFTLAHDSTSSIFKLYGTTFVTTTANSCYITISTTLRPEASYNINPAGLWLTNTGGIARRVNAQINTNGDVVISFATGGNYSGMIVLFPCLYFNTDFGDSE